MLTAVILAKNEEAQIVRTLQSLSFCDEILVIDDLSSDNTATLAQQHGARVIERELQADFAMQRSIGLSEAANDWVLCIDADEVVSGDLQDEIVSILSSKKIPHDVYRVPRIDYWCDKELRRGELHTAANQGIVRLVRKDAGSWQGSVHEVFQPSDGKSVGQLSHALHHYPHQTVTEFILEVNTYSTYRAQELFDQSYPFRLSELLLYPPGKFVYTYFFRGGILDGAPGFIYAFLMSFHSFLVRAKLFQYYLTSSE